jgi:hypothetical protein
VFTVSFADRWWHAAALVVLCILWAAGLWLTRKPVAS